MTEQATAKATPEPQEEESFIDFIKAVLTAAVIALSVNRRCMVRTFSWFGWNDGESLRTGGRGENTPGGVQIGSPPGCPALRVGAPTPYRGQHLRPGEASSAVFHQRAWLRRPGPLGSDRSQPHCRSRSSGDELRGIDHVAMRLQFFGPGWRMYYVERSGAIIVMLGGGDKSNQAADIRKAIKLAKEL